MTSISFQSSPTSLPSPFSFSHLSEEEAHDLIKFYERIPIYNKPTFKGTQRWAAEQIKTWLNDSKHQEQLNSCNTLNLSKLNLTVLPSEICKFNQLEEINLSCNQLTKLPDEIGELKELKNLNLGWNKLTDLPQSISNLNDIQSIILNCNSFKNIPSEVQNFKKLHSIDISSNEITIIPDWIQYCTSLTNLKLNGNKISEIPACIRNLVNLSSLLLAENQISTISPAIGRLKNLEILDLSHNLISELPDELGELDKLDSLLLSKNRLSTLPDSITRLSNLVALHLQKNPLIDLPTDLRNFKELIICNPTLYGKKLNPTSLRSIGNAFAYLKKAGIANIENRQKILQAQHRYLGVSKKIELDEKKNAVLAITTLAQSSISPNQHGIKMPPKELLSCIASYLTPRTSADGKTDWAHKLVENAAKRRKTDSNQ